MTPSLHFKRYGKSKIWLALNPQPLAFQTAADKREQEEEGANFVGMVGGGSRGFGGNAMGGGAGGGDEEGNMPEEEDDFVDDGALDVRGRILLFCYTFF